MSFGEDLFGGPPWKDLLKDEAAAGCIAAAGAGSTVPIAIDAEGNALRRVRPPRSDLRGDALARPAVNPGPGSQPCAQNFVHVEDLVGAMLAALGNPVAAQQKYNICMVQPRGPAHAHIAPDCRHSTFHAWCARRAARRPSALTAGTCRTSRWTTRRSPPISPPPRARPPSRSAAARLPPPAARAPGVVGRRPSEAGWAQCETEFESTWLDNSKAKFQLGWRPGYDMARLVDSAWAYERAPGDERVIYYPG
jgi:hypothetical protein